MATAFMVPRALLLSSLLLLSACNRQTDIPTFNARSLHLENRNGVVYNGQTLFTGKVLELNETSDTIAFYGFYKGREHGRWKRFYQSGQTEEERYFYKGKKIRSLSRWWANGKKQLVCSFKKGEYEGPLKEWNENGQLVREMNYRNGHEDGSQKMYYDNGKTRSNYVVRNGKRTGLLGTKNCINVSDSIFEK